MSLGETLRSLRTEKQLSLQDVANIFNLEKTTIANYEKNERKPDYEMLKKFAAFYDVTVDYLLGITEERNIYKIEKEQVPSLIKELGVEYYTLAKEMKEDDLTPEEIRTVIEALKKIKKGWVSPAFTHHTPLSFYLQLNIV